MAVAVFGRLQQVVEIERPVRVAGEGHDIKAISAIEAQEARFSSSAGVQEGRSARTTTALGDPGYLVAALGGLAIS